MFGGAFDRGACPSHNSRRQNRPPRELSAARSPTIRSFGLNSGACRAHLTASSYSPRTARADRNAQRQCEIRVQLQRAAERSLGLLVATRSPQHSRPASYVPKDPVRQTYLHCLDRGVLAHRRGSFRFREARSVRADRDYSSGSPALRNPSSMWAWSCGRCHGTRWRTNMSKAAGAIVMAFASISLASSMRPVWPSAAASQR